MKNPNLGLKPFDTYAESERDSENYTKNHLHFSQIDNCLGQKLKE